MITGQTGLLHGPPPRRFARRRAAPERSEGGKARPERQVSRAVVS
jgi:hypothetical protein